MTNMRYRGTQRQYLAAAFAGIPSDDHGKPLSWQEQEILSGEGSPP
jgi:hypothetical protein